jgi:hypothetical protein
VRTRRIGALVLALAWLAGAAPAAGQGFNQVGFAVTTTAVTLTTTTENVAVSSGPVTATRPTVNVCVIGYAEVTTGADTTDLTPRIRRGTAITGTLVSEENDIDVQAAAGSTEQIMGMACEQRSNVATVEYSFTVDQVGATGNGSVVYAVIMVFVR